MGKGSITDTERADLKARNVWGAFLACRDKHEKKGLSKGKAERAAYEECSKGSAEEKEESLPAAPAELADKEASEVEIIRWVARNIDNPGVTPEDCPDPFAWTLLRQCRQIGPTFVTFFIEKMWAKLIPSKAHLIGNDEDDGPIDGQPTIEFLEKVRAAGKGQRKESAA